MRKIIEVEFSPNGILGRVTGPDSIVYPGVFLGLQFDVSMPRGTAVYGPDVTPDTVIDVQMPPGTHLVTSGGVPSDPAETAIIRATLPESTPATEHAVTHPVAGVTVSPRPTCNHSKDRICPACVTSAAISNATKGDA